MVDEDGQVVPAHRKSWPMEPAFLFFELTLMRCPWWVWVLQEGTLDFRRSAAQYSVENVLAVI